MTAHACSTLDKHGVIKPWPVTTVIGGRNYKLEGLYKIDESVLNSLPGEAFLELRAVGALPVAYCQLLSEQHLEKVSALGHQRSTLKVNGQQIFIDDDMIKFDFD